MKKDLVFHNKTIQIECSAKAEEMASKLSSPLVIEIQIYFSCMLGKRLAYYSDTPIPGAYQLEPDQFKEILDDSQQLTGNVYIRFNVVMTIDCSITDYVGPPPVTDFEIVNREVYVPHWLNIDVENGVFIGEYGWKSSKPGMENTKQVRDTLLQKSEYLRS